MMNRSLKAVAKIPSMMLMTVYIARSMMKNIIGLVMVSLRTSS